MSITVNRTLRIAALALLLLLLFCMLPQDADAASYKSGSVYDTTESSRVKIGGQYFWMSEGWDALYCSDSEDGKSSVIINAEKAGTDIVLEGNGILCNGSKVYFSAKPSGSQKTVFYRCNVDGTGLKKVKTFTDKADEYMYYRPLAIYNNVLFYEKYGDKGSDSLDSLYSLGLKSGTVKRRVKNFFHDWESGGGRYIYYSKWNEDGSTTLKAYDCKKFKSVTVAKDANAIGTYNSKLYYYKVVYSNGDYSTYNSKIYRRTLSGKEDKSVKTLKDANCTKIKGSKIYYYTGSWGPYDYYYYDLKEKGNPVPITLEEYKAA